MTRKPPARKPPHRYHHGDLRAALVRAGLQAIRKEGIDGLSLRGVARLAGVTRTAPYAHFEDKDALIAAIRAEAQRQFGALMQRQVDTSAEGVEPAYAMARAYVAFACEEPALFQLITGPDAPMRSRSLQGMDEYVAGITVLFNTIAKLAGSGPSSPVTMAAALAGLAMTRGIAQLLIDGHISPALLGLKTRDELVTTLCKFLRPPETSNSKGQN